MGLASPNRPLKDNGTTGWVTGDSLNQTDVEGDFTAITDELDGNIENVNISATAAIEATKLKSGDITDTQISASAAIAVSKLDQTTGQLDSDIVQAIGSSPVTDAEYNTTVDPLDSAATPSIPTTLDDEIQRIKFVLQRYGIGVPTQITDATNAAAWYDGLVVGPELVPNGSFLDNQTSSPVGYTVTGTPATHQLVALPATEGYGKYLNFADTAAGGGSTSDGPNWTLSGLRGNTLYLVEVRLLNTTAEVNLTTTGATGTFGNLDLSTNSTDAHPASKATDWQTIAGLVETDATPTNIVVLLRPSATTYDYGVAYVSVREVSSSRDAETTGREHMSVRGGNIVQTASSSATTAANLQTETTLTFVVPGNNYQAIISGRVFGDDNTPGPVARIQENDDVDGAGSYSTVDSADTSGTNSTGLPTPLFYSTGVLTAGKTYGYRLSASSDNVGVNGTHRIVVQLIRMN